MCVGVSCVESEKGIPGRGAKRTPGCGPGSRASDAGWRVGGATDGFQQGQGACI